MYDMLQESWLLQELTEKMTQEAREKGLQEGRKEGREEGLQYQRDTLIEFVDARFHDPIMTRLAKGQAAIIQDPRIIQRLILKVGLAQDAEEAKLSLLTWPEGES